MRFLITLILCFSLLCATTVEEKKDELGAVNRELSRQQKLLQQTKAREKATLRNLYIINRNVARTKNELRYNQTKLTVHTQQLNQTQAELQKTANDYSFHQKRFGERLKEMYKTQNLGYLSMFFTNKSFSELVDNSYYYKKIIDTDVENITRLNAARQSMTVKQYVLQQQKKEIEKSHQLIQKQKTLLESRAKQQQTVYASIRAQRKEYERRVNELLKNSNEIETMIKRLSASKPVVSRGSGIFIWPVKGIITSYFGYRRHPIFKVVKYHTGIDIGVASGKPIKAADSGIVIFSGWFGGYGNATIIEHGKGLQTVYGHQLRRYVVKGDKVEKGQVIGLVGSTGYSTGPHLHFEVRRNGVVQNPMQYLP